ncbi:hypothetical protein CORC01_14406 [Colletotrichum orchidophilum]|uniref:Uncharacterized protein n=1 Tax=Colletotrichum orchidophilum TaxID=1209926 RepID=A0A1G4AMG1_9PEZI|nr:uncharacterized protein CORC01_14406 [Colletotrichum orchidophilum]OHE90296.1 hypothetical protein CORC01_14406 [Colletotrichum orchidophilum]
MLRIPQLMDAPSTSNGEEIFGAKEVSKSVTASASLEFFREHGLFYTENAAVGGIVDALDQQGLSSSPDSFKFFSGCIIGDERIQSILRPYLLHPNPQVCRSFGSDPGHIFAFALGPTHGDRVVVHMWGAGSRVVFYDSSHKKPLKGVLAANGLLEVPLASLRKNGCEPIDVQMDKGGIAILHYRHAFQIKTGFTSAYGLESPTNNDTGTRGS